MRSTPASKLIEAPPEKLYRALLEPEALAAWLPPGDMTGVVHNFDASVGGGYEMSLIYPQSEQQSRGKTSKHEDRFTVRFTELLPPRRIVEAVTFESSDEEFSGEMKVIWTFDPAEGGTLVTVVFENIPPGIRLEDNEAGSELSLNQLARYVLE